MGYMLITASEDNAKLAKNTGVVSGALFMAPAAEGPEHRAACPQSSRGCRAICLIKSGRMPMVSGARMRRSATFNDNRKLFDQMLIADLTKLQAEADAAGVQAVFRPNGTSDYRWERIPVDGVTMMERFPRMQFMDYTKIPGRHDLPPNYYLNFSLSENNDEAAEFEFQCGRNVTIILALKKGQPMPESICGRPVWDGDMNDLRFKDPAGHWVGLRVKGHTAIGNTHGIVRDPHDGTPVTTANQWISLGFNVATRQGGRKRATAIE